MYVIRKDGINPWLNSNRKISQSRLSASALSISPLDQQFQETGRTHAFYGDDSRVLLDHNLAHIRGTFESGAEPLCFESAGPRRKIFFKPEDTTCAIVTCGGLCPGLNDVIRSIVMQAYYRYKVPRTLGIAYGFEGLIPDYGHG